MSQYLPIEIIKAIIEYVPEYGFAVNRELHNAALNSETSIYATKFLYMAINVAWSQDNHITDVEYIEFISQRLYRQPHMCKLMVLPQNIGAKCNLGQPQTWPYRDLADFEPWVEMKRMIKEMNPVKYIEYRLRCKMHTDHPDVPKWKFIDSSLSYYKWRSISSTLIDQMTHSRILNHFAVLVAWDVGLISDGEFMEASCGVLSEDAFLLAGIFIVAHNIDVVLKWICLAYADKIADICVCVMQEIARDPYTGIRAQVHEKMITYLNCRKLEWGEVAKYNDLLVASVWHRVKDAIGDVKDSIAVYDIIMKEVAHYRNILDCGK